MASAPPNKPLTCDRFQRKPKKIFMAPTFRDLTGEAGDEPYVSNLLEFRRRIEQGLELPPRFYRNGIGQSSDDLLTHTGVKHIHLGKAKTDVLLFVQEFDDFVVLLEIAHHRSNFHEVPVGATLTKYHIASLQPELPGWAAQGAQALATAGRAVKLAVAREQAKLKVLAKKPPKP